MEQHIAKNAAATGRTIMLAVIAIGLLRDDGIDGTFAIVPALLCLTLSYAADLTALLAKPLAAAAISMLCLLIGALAVALTILSIIH